MKIQSAVLNLSLLALAAGGAWFFVKRLAEPKLIRDARGNVYDNEESARIHADENALFGIK